MTERTVDELLVVIARSLGATSARVLSAADADARHRSLEGSGVVTLACDLVDARRLVVELPAVSRTPSPAAKELAALQRRLEMLVETFSDLLPRPARPRPSSRPEGGRSLHDELVALAARGGAADALVIDAHSPVLWGSAAEVDEKAARDGSALVATPLHRADADDAQAALQGLASAQGVRVDPGAMAVVPRAVCAYHRVLPIARSGDKLVLAVSDPRNAQAIHDVVLTTGLNVEPVFAGESMAAFFKVLDEGVGDASYEQALAAIGPELRAEREPMAQRAKASWERAMRARQVIGDLRALPELDTLRRGAHLRRMISEGDLHYVARSFAAIYVLVLVYDGPFEELLAKRAIAHALPAVEKLVAALPPLDPTPKAGAIAIRRRPRRR